MHVRFARNVLNASRYFSAPKTTQRGRGLPSAGHWDSARWWDSPHNSQEEKESAFKPRAVRLGRRRPPHRTHGTFEAERPDARRQNVLVHPHYLGAWSWPLAGRTQGTHTHSPVSAAGDKWRPAEGREALRWSSSTTPLCWPRCFQFAQSLLPSWTWTVPRGCSVAVGRGVPAEAGHSAVTARHGAVCRCLQSARSACTLHRAEPGHGQGRFT